jgi:hypothetical protein
MGAKLVKVTGPYARATPYAVVSDDARADFEFHSVRSVI